MSNIKRTFDQLGIPGLSNSNKRPRSPQPAAQNPRDPSGSSQPTNAASSSAGGPPNQPRAPANICGKSKATGHAILSTLKGSMKLLRKGCGAFPPLESAAATLQDVLEAIEATVIASDNQSSVLHNLASDLPQWAIVLSAYVSNQNPEGMSRGIEHLAKTLCAQAEYLRKQQQSGGFRQLSSPGKGLEELQACQHHIESAFQQLQTDSSLNTWRIADKQLNDSQMNGLSPAHDARYDSSFSDKIKRRTCFENTRVTVLDEVRYWIYGSDGAKIYWMNGMAGTGKTTIAYSVCAELEKNHLFGASFFCSRTSAECSDVSRILPTIAYQLAQHSYPFRCALCRRLGEQPNVGQRNLLVQFEHLIQLPLLEVQDVLPNGLVIVIDALDECSNPETMETMLNMLLRYTERLPIRFFLTSRPEPSVSTPILSKQDKARSVLYLHDVEKSLVRADIETYLTVTLAKFSFPINQIKQLVDQAGILFIYAATASRYVLAGGHRDNAIVRLAAVLTPGTNGGSKKDQDIDKLYKTILAAAMDHEKLDDAEAETIRKVLWTVVSAKEPVTTAALADLLELNVGQVIAALDPLRSVVNIARDDSMVSTLHASFPDFLLNAERSERFRCNPQEHNSYLAAQCFRLMERSLRFNICDLETSHQLDREVTDLESRVEQAITLGLFYACRYWADHFKLASATLSTELVSMLDRFLKHRLLFWMEVLNLKKCSIYGEAALGQAVDQLSKKDEYIELRDFAHDAHNFATSFTANPCSLSTPHIYISALPFTSRESQIWKTYWPRMQGLICVEGVGIYAREQSALATWVAGDSVNSIALSSDGKRVVSGLGSGDSGDESKLVIWDTSSGTPIFKLLEDCGNGVASVAFSPDDTLIASGSEDGTVRIWDATKGELIGNPLQGHSEPVTSVAFSTDGARLASGCWGSTIRMWDAYTGAQLGEPLEGHQDCATSVAFSPNGVHLASSSDNHTIRVWDFQAGTVVYTLIGGNGSIDSDTSVNPIAYSYDGLRLVSGSADRTVRVWDATDGALFSGPFEGHTDDVMSVSFSPDGTRVVSGSFDRTIRVWETVSGSLLAGPFEGRSYITSVVCTADGTRILSGSGDGTIRVWDARRGSKGATKSLGHSGVISSVALSPDGTRVASGSNDGTICVWDTCDGRLVVGPITGHTKFNRVNSVAFSPDGARIVSGFQGGYTLRTWDACTGALLVNSCPTEGGWAIWVDLVAFSPDGSRIASGSKNGTILLYDSHTGASVAKSFRANPVLKLIAFSSDGARIVSISSGAPHRPGSSGSVQIWDANSGIALCTSRPHAHYARCVAISPDWTRVVSSLNLGGPNDPSSDNILVFDAARGTVVVDTPGGVWSVAFSPDGTRVVSGDGDGTVRVWDAESGTMVAGPLNGHTGCVMCVAFSPDGARIISGSWDHIRIWDVAAITQASPISRDNWSIDDNGWLADSNSRRLFWVPSDLRSGFGFLTPSNPIVINGCTTRVEDATLLRDRWRGCYNTAAASVCD